MQQDGRGMTVSLLDELCCVLDNTRRLETVGPLTRTVLRRLLANHTE